MQKFFKGFGYAFRGIKKAVWTERNLRFHLGAAVLALCLGLIAGISTVEYILLFTIIGIIISLEMMNSAIERAVDLETKGEKSALAGKAKDIAAGSVLISAFFALLSGIMLFCTQGRPQIIFSFFRENLWAVAMGIIFVVLWLLWVFRGNFSDVDKEEDKDYE